MVICKLLTLTWLIYCELLRCSFFLPCSLFSSKAMCKYGRLSYTACPTILQERSSISQPLVTLYMLKDTTKHQIPYESSWMAFSKHVMYSTLAMVLWLYQILWSPTPTPPRNRPMFLWQTDRWITRDGSRGALELGFPKTSAPKHWNSKKNSCPFFENHFGDVTNQSALKEWKKSHTNQCHNSYFNNNQVLSDWHTV